MTSSQWHRVAEHLGRWKEVVAIYLFGSQARGESDHLSDVDLAVLLQRDLSKETMWHLESKLAVEVSDLLQTSNVDFYVLNLAPLSAQFEIPLC
jgi:predicted nucleotidyltransferase